MTFGSQMPELDRGAFAPPPPYKIGSQNTPYKLGLREVNKERGKQYNEERERKSYEYEAREKILCSY